jgi:hypothetical protein
MRLMWRRNVIAALVLMCVAAAYGYFTTQLPSRTLPNTPDPAFFPWLNTAVLFALAAILLLQGLADKRTEVEATRWGALQIATSLTLASFVLYLLALPVLGFLLATIPFVAALMLLFGERRPTWLAAGSVGISAFFFVIFSHVFNVFLPRGLLQGLLG